MQDVAAKINDKLKKSGWYSQMRIFLESSDFSDILVELKRKVEVDKQRFCPALNTAFKFLEGIEYNKVQAVMLVDHTCNRLEQADGIPLSSAMGNTFYDQAPTWLFNSIHDGRHSLDVKDWMKQGMLLVPLSLTSRIDGRSHKKLWSPFIMRIIESINKNTPKVPWLLVGADTWTYEDDILSGHVRKLELKNPMVDRQWHHWVNEVLKGQGKPAISW